MLQNFVLKKTCQSTKSLVFIGDFSKTSTDHVYRGSLPHLSQLFAPGPRPCIGKGWSGCLAGTRTPDKNQGPTELPEAIRGNVQPMGIHEYGPNLWGSPSPEQAHTQEIRSVPTTNATFYHFAQVQTPMKWNHPHMIAKRRVRISHWKIEDSIWFSFTYTCHIAYLTLRSRTSWKIHRKLTRAWWRRNFGHGGWETSHRKSRAAEQLGTVWWIWI